VLKTALKPTSPSPSENVPTNLKGKKSALPLEGKREKEPLYKI